jgi:glycine cleavage system transcriptional repressor
MTPGGAGLTAAATAAMAPAMKQWFALSAIGRDRPGIVADLAELIYECDCNLEDSSMAILGSEFAVLLLLSSQAADAERRLAGACKRLEWEKRLTVFFRALEGEPVPYAARERARRYALQAVGVDRAGIVAKIARCLADHGVNIAEMQTQSRPEPESGTPIYTMRMQLDVPDRVDAVALERRLQAIADALQIDVAFGAAPS